MNALTLSLSLSLFLPHLFHQVHKPMLKVFGIQWGAFGPAWSAVPALSLTGL